MFNRKTSKRSLSLVFILFACILSVNVVAQTTEPVRWEFSVQKSASGGFELRMEAILEEGWHIYSQHTPDGGPVATSFSFTKNPFIEKDGVVLEQGKLEKKLEPLFDVEVMQFSDRVVFVQKLKLKTKVKTAINGTVQYMVCNEHQCIPAMRKSFSVALQ